MARLDRSPTAWWGKGFVHSTAVSLSGPRQGESRIEGMGVIPSVLAHQLRRGVEDYLRTMFPVATPFFEGVVDRLLEEEGGVFKGPYLTLVLPLRAGSAGRDSFPGVPLRYPPYRHQEQAFARLREPRPRSTIVATGTGSGKTECFLYPILDHCLKHKGEPGIKAILIYPMNALASDLAGRIASLIWNQPTLQGQVTAGLFVGQKEEHPRKVMTAEGIITDRMGSTACLGPRNAEGRVRGMRAVLHGTGLRRTEYLSLLVGLLSRPDTQRGLRWTMTDLRAWSEKPGPGPFDTSSHPGPWEVTHRQHHVNVDVAAWGNQR